MDSNIRARQRAAATDTGSWWRRRSPSRTPRSTRCCRASAPPCANLSGRPRRRVCCRATLSELADRRAAFAIGPDLGLFFFFFFARCSGVAPTNSSRQRSAPAPCSVDRSAAAPTMTQPRRRSISVRYAGIARLTVALEEYSSCLWRSVCRIDGRTSWNIGSWTRSAMLRRSCLIG